MVIDADTLLESIWLNDDREQRERRTLIHEAGHAATSWLISGIRDAPPFEYIEMQTIELATQGIVPGYVACDPGWFAWRSPIERAEIYLGGVYCQNRAIGLTNAEWLEMLDSLEGGDGVDDVAEARIIGDSLGRDWDSFASEVLSQLRGLEPALSHIAEAISSKLVIGERTYALDLMPIL